MSKIKYLFFDVDGTLLRSDKTVSEEFIPYMIDLKKRKNLTFGIATGRGWNSLSQIMKRIDLQSCFNAFVLDTGANVLDTVTGNNHHVNYMTREELLMVQEAFRPYDFVTFVFHNPGETFASKDSRAIRKVLQRNGRDHFYTTDEKEFVSTSRCMLAFDEEDRPKVEELVKQVKLPGLRGMFSEKYLYDIMHETNSKSNGIRLYVNDYYDTMENVMCFGDEENDCDMLTHAGISVCLKNGNPVSKAVADYITEKTNDEDGVLDFLKNHEYLFD